MTDEQLTTTLRGLPEPDAPPTMQATVMARIERLPTPAPDPTAEPVRRRRDRTARAWASAGLLLVLGLYAYEIAAGTRVGPGLSPYPTMPEMMQAGDLAVPLLGLGLLLYAAGLFAQVSAPRRRRSS